MAFVLPTFNITYDVFSFGAYSPAAARAVNQPCQLRAPSMQIAPNFGGSSFQLHGAAILVPPLTDIRDQFCGAGGSSDEVEVPSGSGRFYIVIWVDDIGRGFPNEHRYAILAKSGLILWPVPIP